MRILHTADWHLGKVVNEFSMLDLQESYLKEFVQKTKELEVDAVIMAGDLYDRSIPPKEAVSLANKVFTKLTQEVGVPVLVIAGNHDSNERIEFGSEMFTGSQLYIEGTTKETVRKVTIADVNFYLLPYDDHRNIRNVLNDPTIRNPEEALAIQIERIKADWNPEAINVLIYHGFMVNQSTDDELETSDSERTLSVGAVEYVPASLVEDFDYVALGHLHKAQRVKGEHIRYSGSPLKYSKSEANYRKQDLLVDLTKDKLVVESLEIKPRKDLRVVRGLFDDILEGSSEEYIFFELEDHSFVLDAMNRLRRKYPYAMGLEYIHQQEREKHTLQHSRKKLNAIQPEELFSDFYEEHTQNTLNNAQKEAVIQTLEEIGREETR